MSGCTSSPLASSDALAPESALVPTSTPGAGTSGLAGPAAGNGGAQSAALSLAALYARVSTDKQEKDATIASQVAALQTAAQAAGYTAHE